MAQKNINIGTSPNSDTGEFVRDAFSKTEDNFIELYAKTGFRDNVLLEGNYNNIPSTYQYFVWANSYIINNTVYSTYINNTVTLSAADPTNDRIDLIILDDTQTISVIEGIAAVNPAKPVTDPITQLEIGLVLVTANTTAPVGVIKTPIYNENLQVVGGEWDTLIVKDALVDKVVDPSLGTTHIHLLFSTTASRIELRNTSLIQVDSFDKIIFKMKKLDTVPSGPYPGGNVCFTFKNESLNNQGKQACFMSTGNSIFGFDESIIGDYQTITIDSSFFGLGNFTITEFDLIEIVKGGNGEYYIDDIYLESGTPISGESCGCIKKTSDIINDGEDGNNPYISNLDIYRDNILLSGNYENIIGTYQFFVWADNYIINNIEYSTYYSDTLTLTAPSVTNGQDRFDVIVISNTGVISAVEGVTSATPEKPLIDDETQVEIGLVLVSGATTNPIGVTNTILYDENLQVAGGEWDTFLQGDAIDSANVEPSNGTIHGVLVTEGDIFAISNPVEVNSGDIDKLRFKIKLISGEEQRFYIRFSKAGLRKQWRIPLYDGIYGFDENNFSTYQTIIIPSSDIGLVVFDTIRFQSRDTGESYLDEIIFQNGTPTDPGTGIPPIIDTNISTNDLIIKDNISRKLDISSGGSLDIKAINTRIFLNQTTILLQGLSNISLTGGISKSSIILTNDLILKQQGVSNSIFIQPTDTSISTIGQVLTATGTLGEVAWQDATGTNISNENLTITTGTFRDLIIEPGAAFDILAGLSTNIYIDENEINMAGNSQITLLGGSGNSSISLSNDILLRQNNIANSIFIQPTNTSVSTIGQVLTAVDTLGKVAWQDNILPTGLEAINEGGGGSGLVKIGSSPTDRRSVGWNALDLSSRFLQPINIPGAGGYSSMVIGEDSVAADYNDIVLAYYSMATASVNGNGQKFIAGGSSEIFGGTGGAAIGLCLRNTNTWGHVVVGTANLDVSGSNSPSVATDPVFTVGNGTFSTPGSARWLPIAPSNAFQVLKGGEILAPDLTIAKIDTYATGEIVVTKEWVHRELANLITTGVREGGLLSPNVDTTLFDISDGFGYVVDTFTDPENPVITKVTWTGLTALTPTNIATEDLTSIAIGIGSIVVQQNITFTEEQSRDFIVLGTLVHIDNVNITSVEDMSYDASSSYLARDFSIAIGSMNIYGNNFDAASTDLTIKLEAGRTFRHNVNRNNNPKNPNFLNLPLIDPLTFLYTYDNGSGGNAIITGQTLFDPSMYDDKTGTLAAIPVGNNWVNHWGYLFPGGNEVLLRYGETIYSTLDEAKAAWEVVPTTIGIDFKPEFIRTVFSVKQGTTDLSNATNVFIKPTGKFGLT